MALRKLARLKKFLPELFQRFPNFHCSIQGLVVMFQNLLIDTDESVFKEGTRHTIKRKSEDSKKVKN